MRERSRRWMMRAAWAVLFITGAMLVGLRIGRPVYYTDGEREISGGELTAAGMLVWQTPEVEVELPGPVAGRVAELPDGRLLYGRTVADGTTDLVIFDPERPDVSPEPAYGLNTGDNELAPACANDGTVYFASDRPSGVGGYDLYRATWTERGFSRPSPVELCNTAFDETDPAPSPNGVDFVFVRVDRDHRGGDHGELHRCRLGSGIEPGALFPGTGSRRTVVDRDPAFSPDGGALWFVRKDVGVPLHLCRVSVLNGELDQPSAIGSNWGVNRLRGPLPARDGARLGLLQPRSKGEGESGGGADLWFVSAGREVYPWWLGQRWLEWILLGLFLTSLLLLLLLHLGRRWTALDLLAQCLLLSLLVHILLFLWLMGVEITGALLDGNEDGGSLEVTVLTASVSDTRSVSDGQRLASVAAMVRFDPAERSFEVTAPGAAAERVEASAIEAPDSGYESTAEATEATTKADVVDELEAAPVRSGTDAALATEQATLPAVRANASAAEAAATSALAAVGSSAVVVSAPGGAVGRASQPRQLVTAGSAGRGEAPNAREVEVSRPAAKVSAPLASAARREGSAASEAVPGPSATDTALAGPSTAHATVVAAAERRAGSAPPIESPDVTPAAQLARGGSRAELAPRADAAAAVSAPDVSPAHATANVALQDARAEPGASRPTAAEDSPAPAIERVGLAQAGPQRPRASSTARAERAAGSVPPIESAEVPPTAQLARAGSHAELARRANAAAAVPAPDASSAHRTASVALQDPRAAAGAARPTAAEDSPAPVIERAGLALAGSQSPRAMTAARAEREAGSVAPIEPAEVAPTAQLARAGSHAELARRANAAAAVPAPAASSAHRTARVALQDPRAQAGAPRPPTAEDSPAPAIERMGFPAVGPQSPTAMSAARSERAAAVASLEVAPNVPSSQLTRAARRASGPQPSRQSLMTRAVPDRPTARGMALRDRVQRTAVAPRGEATAGAEPAPVRMVALAILPRANPLDRPQRAIQLGAFADPMAPVLAPGSLLERASAVHEVAASPGPALNAAVTAYSNRFGPRKAKALERFGGSVETERAVADGLRYLARIQNRDGSWGSRDRFDGKYGLVYVGKSALCVLAFLGAGHTPSSNTEYSAVVARALDHLLELQDEDTGAFGASSCYGHGITTYALAECYGMTKNPALLAPLEEALNWILENQGPRRDRRNRGGWGYFSPGLRREDSYARVSVTSWMVMALESARMSGIELPDAVLPRAREYLEASFDAPNGWFRYNQKPSRLRSGWPTLPASTPAGAFCLQLLGAKAEHNMVRAALEFTVERRPRAYRRYSDDDFVLRGQGNVYFWYYGTLCCFLAGGEAWEEWNQRLSTLLPAAQSEDGSFAPIDVYAIDAGDNRRDRSYTTAMCVLSLEVYYRYFTPLLLGR